MIYSCYWEVPLPHLQSALGLFQDDGYGNPTATSADGDAAAMFFIEDVGGGHE